MGKSSFAWLNSYPHVSPVSDGPSGTPNRTLARSGAERVGLYGSENKWLCRLADFCGDICRSELRVAGFLLWPVKIRVLMPIRLAIFAAIFGDSGGSCRVLAIAAPLSAIRSTRQHWRRPRRAAVAPRWRLQLSCSCRQPNVLVFTEKDWAANITVVTMSIWKCYYHRGGRFLVWNCISFSCGSSAKSSSVLCVFSAHSL